MRPRVPWMTEIDDVILDYLYDIGTKHEHQVVQPPKTVWWNLVEELEMIDRSPTTVRRRMQKLTEEGLLEQIEAKGTYYRLTDLGVRYVEGDVTLDELSIDRDDEE